LGLGHLVAERIRSETRDGLAILVQQRLPGRTPAADDLSSSRLQERIALAMEPLEALHRRPRPPPARPDDRLVAVELPRAIASLPRYRSILEPTLAAVAAWLERRRLPAVLTHGDYWIGNLLFDDQGPTLTGIFDWEWFRPDGCTGLDALQLGCFSNAEWQKVKPPEIFGCVLEGTSVPDPLKAHIARVKTAFDLDDEDIGYLTLMLWLLRVYSNAYIHPASEAEVLTLVEQPAAAARRWLDRHRAGPVTGPVRERDGGAC
jgi:hypothetical protein